MKQIPHSKFFKYPMSKLYKDDVIALYQVFATVSDSVKLKINDWQIEDISEIDTITEKVKEIEIKTSKPSHASLEISNWRTQFYLSDQNDIVSLGLEIADRFNITSKKTVFQIPF